MTDVKTELAHIDGMLNNPLLTIQANLKDMDQSIKEGANFALIVGQYQAMTAQVLDDIKAIKEYIHEQVD
jgi:hypothetical protein